MSPIKMKISEDKYVNAGCVPISKRFAEEFVKMFPLIQDISELNNPGYVGKRAKLQVFLMLPDSVRIEKIHYLYDRDEYVLLIKGDILPNVRRGDILPQYLPVYLELDNGYQILWPFIEYEMKT